MLHLVIYVQVRKLALLVAMGKRVYVHCTAGINRATLTVVGYLTFVQVSLSPHIMLAVFCPAVLDLTVGVRSPRALRDAAQ